jgi:hypothetical protein
MPSHKIHRLIDRLVLGKEMEIVHLIKDHPYKLWPGKKHREWLHDRRTNLLLGVILGPKAFLSAELHDWADNTFIEKDGKLIVKKRRKKR